MNSDIQRVLVSEKEIADANQRLGKQLSEDYAGKNPLFVCILRGAAMFMMDLIKNIDIPLEYDFMDVSSYGGENTVSTGDVKIIKDLDTSLRDRDVVIVEDIIDTGYTLDRLIELFNTRHAKSIRIVSFLDKPSRRIKHVHVDYNGVKIPDEFVVGYGMDYNERYRNLPYVGVLKPEIYSSK
ncbi:hypoxanthine phosphoribosyltransferase [Companilactobacillus sp.]|jgi:hypoxanthine phosphoribosyltransferase|uniref:hypoxanthine phosphoribosyltransferase n=1 Tax=Companilactobacillus sp. TaxID=2767905 RepID=UPI0025B7B86F|nr:hypoxanthine phosphoribosyltransferase [Companilactobacillus sp.]MCH4010157.1 hypoxanthine phosphoribosyltransferase [Companilactobacillus sp.]MCH4052167.1 hypoxanthine phosphoribosyltransferase [Companilactobacillus sp.]MCH4078099.1 hypoxanthine phosphoribosyltransferase [Companilactobacillus sp.]MCH4126675.1 hypoxanthine phosphoribosyltransferase [Companilactobacillus sp.]MCH4132260.1 hypoxanthine phosphoribosyltransferase [Companilactobacillus sp.]